MRSGLAGVDRIGAFHAATFKGLDSVEKVLVADSDLAGGKAVAQKLDCETARDL